MLTRRIFFGSAAAAATLGPMVAFAQDASRGESALVTGKPKPFKFEEIPGLLSRDQVAPHVNAHYGGALKALLEIEDVFARAYKGETKLAGREFREVQQERVARANSVLLHELYFDGISAKPPEPQETARKAIEDRFGSIDRWIEDFKASAAAAQGWAMLVVHPVNRRLYNIVLDFHEIGPMVMGIPLALIDVYEHAYYVDYRNKKADYIAAFVKFLDWGEIEARWKASMK